MKKLFILAVLCFAVSVRAQEQPHGITYNWVASPNAATCLSTSTPPCTFGYNLFVGSAAGQESTTPVNTSLITGLTYTYNPAVSPLGTTICAVIQFQETVGALVLNSANSNEICFSFPSAPAPPSGVTITVH